jgi:hypothetical protein
MTIALEDLADREDAMARSGTVRTGQPDGTRDQQSLGDLVALALKDVSKLIRYEISLAKSELRVDVKRVALAGGLIVGGLAIVFPGVILLCFAYAYFLHWAGAWGGLAGAFGFAGLTFLVLAGIACFVAYLGIRRVTGMRLTRRTVAADIGMLRRSGSDTDGADGASPAVGSGGAEVSAGTDGAPASIPARS